MAIDTANKRFSLIGLGLPIPAVFPVPDGSIDAADRLQYLWLYADKLEIIVTYFYTSICKVAKYLPTNILASPYLISAIEAEKYLLSNILNSSYLISAIETEEYLKNIITISEEICSGDL